MKIKQLALYLPVLILLFILVHNINAQSTDFFDTLLDQKSIHASHSLVFLNITFKEYNGRATITNSDLFVYLKLTKDFDKKKYNAFVVDLIKNKKTLAIDESRVTRNRSRLRGGVFEFILLSKDYAKVDELAGKGKDKFINHFFSKQLMKGKIVREYNDLGVMYKVADKLFQWQLITQIDDTTGLLRLVNCSHKLK